MVWKEVDDEERVATLETEGYEIFRNQRHEYEEPNGYLLFSKEKIGLLDHNGNVVCGLGMYCAVGAPPEAIFQTIDEAKAVVE